VSFVVGRTIKDRSGGKMTSGGATLSVDTYSRRKAGKLRGDRRRTVKSRSLKFRRVSAEWRTESSSFRPDVENENFFKVTEMGGIVRRGPSAWARGPRRCLRTLLYANAISSITPKEHATCRRNWRTGAQGLAVKFSCEKSS